MPLAALRRTGIAACAHRSGQAKPCWQMWIAEGNDRLLERRSHSLHKTSGCHQAAVCDEYSGKRTCGTDAKTANQCSMPARVNRALSLQWLALVGLGLENCGKRWQRIFNSTAPQHRSQLSQRQNLLAAWFGFRHNCVNRCCRQHAKRTSCGQGANSWPHWQRALQWTGNLGTVDC